MNRPVRFPRDRSSAPSKLRFRGIGVAQQVQRAACICSNKKMEYKNHHSGDLVDSKLWGINSPAAVHTRIPVFSSLASPRDTVTLQSEHSVRTERMETDFVFQNG